MKFIHLSDLHLGKRVNEFSMLEDQNVILQQIFSIVKEEQVDAVLLAGDIYDKPVPPTDAVRLFDAFLNALAEEGVQVFCISGNHDSAERLSFGNALMQNRGVYIAPALSEVPEPIVKTDTYGEVRFYLLPFLKPAHTRALFPEEGIESYEDAVRLWISKMQVDSSVRNVILTHQFVAGATQCESEEMSIGGSEQISVRVFDPFDYVALGHIHSPQKIERETVRYCGTPLKYSFSECKHDKSVTVVTMREKGTIEIRTRALHPMRDLVELKETYETLVSRSFYEQFPRDSYFHMTLTNEEEIPDVLQKLRVIYPNIMKLDYENTRTKENRVVGGSQDVQKKTPLELFGELYELQNNQSLTERQEEILKAMMEQIWEER